MTPRISSQNIHCRRKSTWQTCDGGAPAYTAATNLGTMKFPHIVVKRFTYFSKRSKRDCIENLADIGYSATFIVLKIIIDISFILDFPKEQTFSISHFVKKYVFYVLQEHESDIN